MSEYTQGVCHDGAAIIKDGQPLTIEQILEALQERETLVARIAELERYNLGLANESCELQERVARLNKALTRQANAAKLGMNAAKAVASSELEQAKRLHAESSPAALESEREANARLTELVAQLEQERDALAALFVKLQEGATDLIHASSEEEAGDAMELIAGCSEKDARNILARRDSEQRAKALTETAKWFAALHTRTELLSAEVVYDILMDQSRRQTEGPQ